MRTMRKQTVASALAGFVMILGMGVPASGQIQADARIQIHPRPTQDLQISVWPDRGEGAAYTIGDPIAMNVEANKDCFLILYNVDTRGNLRILFPYDPWDDNFVQAGDVIRFPRPQDGYDWTVDGPQGIEYVQAIATEFPIDPPDWPVYMRSVNHGSAVDPDPELRDFCAGSNRLDYIGVINRKITGRYWNWTATDLATFHVIPRYYQHVNINYDPWPDEFYGEVYINWPIGASIYVDGVYIGIAPLWLPRSYYGRHVVTCFRGPTLVRRHAFVFYPKHHFRGRIAGHDWDDIREHGFAREGRRGGLDRFGDRMGRYKERRGEYRPNVIKERADDRRESGNERVKNDRRDDRSFEPKVKNDDSREWKQRQPATRGWNAAIKPSQPERRELTAKREAQFDAPQARPEPQARVQQPARRQESGKGWLGTVTGAVSEALSGVKHRGGEGTRVEAASKSDQKKATVASKSEQSRELTGKSKQARSGNKESSKRGKR